MSLKRHKKINLLNLNLFLLFLNLLFLFICFPSNFPSNFPNIKCMVRLMCVKNVALFSCFLMVIYTKFVGYFLFSHPNCAKGSDFIIRVTLTLES